MWNEPYLLQLDQIAKLCNWIVSDPLSFPLTTYKCGIQEVYFLYGIHNISLMYLICGSLLFWLDMIVIRSIGKFKSCYLLCWIMISISLSFIWRLFPIINHPIVSYQSLKEKAVNYDQRLFKGKGKKMKDCYLIHLIGKNLMHKIDLKMCFLCKIYIH